ncbi:hypothetical protein CSQ95_16175 [Janthinobacterium sp. BJB304]|nr:hypothetical protein CSQ95_16175 [Janthinobacterium sp. BJB304]
MRWASAQRQQLVDSKRTALRLRNEVLLSAYRRKKKKLPKGSFFFERGIQIMAGIQHEWLISTNGRLKNIPNHSLAKNNLPKI